MRRAGLQILVVTGQYAIDSFGFGMKGVKAQLIPDPEHNEDTGGYSYGKSDNIDERMDLVMPD